MIEESERLNRFIANLLDMTKLESGAVVPNTARQDIGEIIGSALRRAGKMLAGHRVSLDFAADLPMLELDAVLFEQVLFNLLDNAAKYAAVGTTISIRTVRDRNSILLQIIDEGAGIPPAELESIFDKFYRAQKGDHVRPGTGLGLAISRGFVEAMRGTISAANRTDRSGAVLTIRLPIPDDTRKPAPDDPGWTPRHERRANQGPGRRRRAADPKVAADGAEHARLSRSWKPPTASRAGMLAQRSGLDHSRSRPAGYPGP